MIPTDSDIRSLEPAKPEFHPRIYAWSSDDVAEWRKGCLKIGQTTREDVNVRIKESQGQQQIPYTVEVDRSAARDDGTRITDKQVIARLVDKGAEVVKYGSSEEWVRCTAPEVEAAIAELLARETYEGAHHETFGLRPEQRAAVDKAFAFINDAWERDDERTPEFLWNAKMRFGKTFTTYQLAKRLGAKRVLVLTFKPAVEGAWKEDLENHVDFNGWVFRSQKSLKSDGDPRNVPTETPLVYFASFQDVLGKDRKTGAYKPKNDWLRDIRWDLVVFDEYHFGAWRDTSKELFEGEDERAQKKEERLEFSAVEADFAEALEEKGWTEDSILAIEARAYLYLSGTPFKVLAEGRFIEDQLYNWTYTDEQRAKAEFATENPNERNPYESLPELRLMTYQMPEDIVAVANGGEFNEFDLNAFFAATGDGDAAEFVHKDAVQKWLDIIRGADKSQIVDALKQGGRSFFPYSDTRLLPYMNHSLWMLPRKASCAAMANLLAEPQNNWWRQFTVINVSADGVGVGLAAVEPVKAAIGNGYETKTITLTVGKLTTGVTVPQWSSMLMLRNLQAPETYFQAAFRVQSPWVARNPNGDDPTRAEVLKPVCYVFDFAPTRALRQVSNYGVGLQPDEPNPQKAVAELVSFLPVLAYDGSTMRQVDAGQVLDLAMSGTSATLLARKWESALLVHVDNYTLDRLLANERALNAVLSIEGFRSLSRQDVEAVVNRSEAIQKTKKELGDDLPEKERKALDDEQEGLKKTRKAIQEKLIKFATRIPAFMYLSDYPEMTLKDVIEKVEPALFTQVTGLSIQDFQLLVSLGVFNSTQMNDAVFAFRRYENASYSYTGINSHPELKTYGGWDTAIPIEALGE